MNKSTAQDCLSIQNSYEMSGLELVKDRKLMYSSNCTTCSVPSTFRLHLIYTTNLLRIWSPVSVWFIALVVVFGYVHDKSINFCCDTFDLFWVYIVPFLLVIWTFRKLYIHPTIHLSDWSECMYSKCGVACLHYIEFFSFSFCSTWQTLTHHIHLPCV